MELHKHNLTLYEYYLDKAITDMDSKLAVNNKPVNTWPIIDCMLKAQKTLDLVEAIFDKSEMLPPAITLSCVPYPRRPG